MGFMERIIPLQLVKRSLTAASACIIVMSWICHQEYQLGRKCIFINRGTFLKAFLQIIRTLLLNANALTMIARHALPIRSNVRFQD